MFPIAEQVLSGQGLGVGYGFFSVSNNGMLAYRTETLQKSQLIWKDRRGNKLSTLGQPQPIEEFELSPNGKKVVVSIRESALVVNLWLLDDSGGAPIKFTTNAPGVSFSETRSAVWSRDGASIAYSVRTSSAQRNIYIRAANGVGKEELLFHTAGTDAYPNDWSADGKSILYSEVPESVSQGSSRNLWRLPVQGDRKPVAYAQTIPGISADGGRFSPDGQWVVYYSNESGRAEVYVRRFPDTGEKWPVSTMGGGLPQWRSDGKEIFYLAPSGHLMSVAIKPGSTFTAGPPQALFEVGERARSRTLFQPSADGERFLMLYPFDAQASTPVTVISNWLTRAQK
jgi:Tol biopolymer transport system component